MIKKPEPITKADHIRGQDAINKKRLAQNQYEEYILTNLIKEFGTASIGELLFCVVEKYHTKLKVKHQSGTKRQWSDLLAAIIKTEVDSRRAGKNTLKAVIHELKKDPLWAPFVSISEEQFKKVYKQKPDAFCSRYVKHCHQSEADWGELVKAERSKYLNFKK